MKLYEDDEIRIMQEGAEKLSVTSPESLEEAQRYLTVLRAVAGDAKKYYQAAQKTGEALKAKIEAYNQQVHQPSLRDWDNL